MGRTKKVGSTGRFGAKYGSTVRKRVKAIEVKLRAKHVCPRCRSPSVKRVAVGIWVCRKCNLKFTGGAYIPKTRLLKGASPVDGLS
ncbi:MAG: 50S ribosomal protein L37ae [Candidatus Asgardarchaeia archaeon]